MNNEDFKVVLSDKEYIEKLEKEVHYRNKEVTRLNNTIERINNFADRTIEVIKQQPSGNDEWILERLNGIKYLVELNGGDKE